MPQRQSSSSLSLAPPPASGPAAASSAAGKDADALRGRIKDVAGRWDVRAVGSGASSTPEARASAARALHGLAGHVASNRSVPRSELRHLLAHMLLPSGWPSVLAALLACDASRGAALATLSTLARAVPGLVQQDDGLTGALCACVDVGNHAQAGAACEVLLQLLPQWRFSALWAAWAAAGGPGRVLTALEQWMKPAAAGLTGRSSAGARSEGVARSALVLVQLQVRMCSVSPSEVAGAMQADAVHVTRWFEVLTHWLAFATRAEADGAAPHAAALAEAVTCLLNHQGAALWRQLARHARPVAVMLLQALAQLLTLAKTASAASVDTTDGGAPGQPAAPTAVPSSPTTPPALSAEGLARLRAAATHAACMLSHPCLWSVSSCPACRTASPPPQLPPPQPPATATSSAGAAQDAAQGRSWSDPYHSALSAAFQAALPHLPPQPQPHPQPEAQPHRPRPQHPSATAGGSSAAAAGRSGTAAAGGAAPTETEPAPAWWSPCAPLHLVAVVLASHERTWGGLGAATTPSLSQPLHAPPTVATQAGAAPPLAGGPTSRSQLAGSSTPPFQPRTLHTCPAAAAAATALLSAAHRCDAVAFFAAQVLAPVSSSATPTTRPHVVAAAFPAAEQALAQWVLRRVSVVHPSTRHLARRLLGRAAAWWCHDAPDLPPPAAPPTAATLLPRSSHGGAPGPATPTVPGGADATPARLPSPLSPGLPSGDRANQPAQRHSAVGAEGGGDAPSSPEALEERLLSFRRMLSSHLSAAAHDPHASGPSLGLARELAALEGALGAGGAPAPAASAASLASMVGFAAELAVHLVPPPPLLDDDDVPPGIQAPPAALLPAAHLLGSGPQGAEHGGAAQGAPRSAQHAWSAGVAACHVAAQLCLSTSLARFVDAAAAAAAAAAPELAPPAGGAGPASSAQLLGSFPDLLRRLARSGACSCVAVAGGGGRGVLRQRPPCPVHHAGGPCFVLSVGHPHQQQQQQQQQQPTSPQQPQRPEGKAPPPWRHARPGRPPAGVLCALGCVAGLLQRQLACQAARALSRVYGRVGVGRGLLTAPSDDSVGDGGGGVAGGAAPRGALPHLHLDGDGVDAAGGWVVCLEVPGGADGGGGGDAPAGGEEAGRQRRQGAQHMWARACVLAGTALGARAAAAAAATQAREGSASPGRGVRPDAPSVGDVPAASGARGERPAGLEGSCARQRCLHVRLKAGVPVPELRAALRFLHAGAARVGAPAAAPLAPPPAAPSQAAAGEGEEAAAERSALARLARALDMPHLALLAKAPAPQPGDTLTLAHGGPPVCALLPPSPLLLLPAAPASGAGGAAPLAAVRGGAGGAEREGGSGGAGGGDGAHWPLERLLLRAAEWSDEWARRGRRVVTLASGAEEASEAASTFADVLVALPPPPPPPRGHAPPLGSTGAGDESAGGRLGGERCGPLAWALPAHQAVLERHGGPVVAAACSAAWLGGAGAGSGDAAAATAVDLLEGNDIGGGSGGGRRLPVVVLPEVTDVEVAWAVVAFACTGRLLLRPGWGGEACGACAAARTCLRVARCAEALLLDGLLALCRGAFELWVAGGGPVPTSPLRSEPRAVAGAATAAGGKEAEGGEWLPETCLSALLVDAQLLDQRWAVELLVRVHPATAEPRA